MTTLHPPRAATRPSWLIALGLAAIILLAVGGSVYWTAQNVTLVGRDSAGHLQQSILTADALAAGTPAGIFQAITLDDYRPPALYLLTQPFYALLGRDLDVAQAANIALLAAILLLTFLLARRALSDGMALFATLLLALLPMQMAMSRLYYMENLLTAALLAGLLVLLVSEGFAHRGWSLVWGIAFGLALLVKWTAPIYLLAPTLYLLWRTGFWAAQRAALRNWRIDWRRAIVAAIAAAGLALLWHGAGRDFVLAQQMPLDDWLPLAWALLWAPLLYALAHRGGRVANLWTALLLAAAIASLWYFPRIDFVDRLGDVAFGTDRGTQEAWDLTRFSNYTRYFGYWLSHHMGPLATLLIIPAALLGWLLRWRRRIPTGLTLTLCWLTVVTAYVILMLLAQSNPRNLAPLLPTVAILLAAALAAYARPLAISLAALWVTVLGVQWSIYTVDAGAALFARTPALWVNGDYLQWPATGSTDPGFWIHPQVLATIGDPEGEADSLGILVDTWEVHRGAFRYLAEREQQNLTIMALTEDNSRGWSDALANRWLLVKDGDNSLVKAPGQAVLARIAAGDDLFEQLYAPAATYPLPNGDTLTLYRRSGPQQPQDYPVILIETQPIAEALNAWWDEGATLVFGDADVALWTGLHDLRAKRILLPGADGGFTPALDELTGTIFVVSRYDPAARDAVAADAYFARELVSGDTVLDVYGRPVAPLVELPVENPWSEIAVERLATLPALRGGEVLPVALDVTAPAEPALKLSVRLLNGAGEVVAQNDVPAANGVRLGLLVPPDAPPGTYTLGAVLYDPATLTDRLTLDGAQIGSLAAIAVSE
jgi:hypothetical protein